MPPFINFVHGRDDLDVARAFQPVSLKRLNPTPHHGLEARATLAAPLPRHEYPAHGTNPHFSPSEMISTLVQPPRFRCFDATLEFMRAKRKTAKRFCLSREILKGRVGPSTLAHPVAPPPSRG
jgi:hypothetical protein